MSSQPDIPLSFTTNTLSFTTNNSSNSNGGNSINNNSNGGVNNGSGGVNNGGNNMNNRVSNYEGRFSKHENYNNSRGGGGGNGNYRNDNYRNDNYRNENRNDNYRNDNYRNENRDRNDNYRGGYNNRNNYKNDKDRENNYKGYYNRTTNEYFKDNRDNNRDRGNNKYKRNFRDVDDLTLVDNNIINSPLNGCKDLIIRLGEMSEKTIEENILTLNVIINNIIVNNENNNNESKDLILKTLYDCLIYQPSKVNIYASLIGLFVIDNIDKNNKITELLNEFAIKLNNELLSSLNTFNFYRLRVLIRFMGAGIANHFIDPQFWFQFVNMLLNLCCNESISKVQYSIGEYLASHFGDQWNEVTQLINQYMDRRIFELSPIQVSKFDILRFYFESLGNNYQNTFILRPWEKVPTIKNCEQGKFFQFGTDYDQFKSSLVEYLSSSESNLITVSASLSFPAPYFTLYNDNHFNFMDRIVISEIIVDILNNMSDHPSVTANLLFNLPLAPCGDYKTIVFETIVSEMFRLPNSAQLQLYYVHVIVAAFQSQIKELPPLMGKAVHNIFEHLDELDSECRNRFVKWFSIHLSNFSYSWPWKNWSENVNLSEDHIKTWFFKNSLSECILLSFHDRLAKTLPDVFLKFLPTAPVFQFRYSQPDTAEELKAIATELTGLLNAEFQPFAMQEWIESKSKIIPIETVIDIAIQSILCATSTSITQSLVFLERYKEILRKPDYRLASLKAITYFWNTGPAHVNMLISKCLSYNIIEVQGIVNFIFEDITKLSNWDLLESIAAVIHKRMQAIVDTISNVSDPSQLEKLENAQRIASRELKTFYSLCIQKIVHLYLNDSDSVWYESLLKQFVRKYNSTIKLYLSDIMEDLNVESNVKTDHVIEILNCM